MDEYIGSDNIKFSIEPGNWFCGYAKILELSSAKAVILSVLPACRKATMLVLSFRFFKQEI
jgi:hypothetical protein